MNLGNVLVTGGLGFIGYNLVGRIDADFDYERILILDQKTEVGHRDTFGINDNDKIEIVSGSILDMATFDAIAASGFQADHIVHTAGFLGVQAVAEHPLLTMDVNILGTRNCLEFALGQDRMQRIVTFSTSEVFGTFANKATEGDMAMIPTDGDRWCYSTSKLASEQYTRAYGRDHDMPYTIVRPFNVYGPHRFGSNAVSRFTEAAVAGDRITVQGDGSQRRAWCHVDDFVGGVLAAMTQPGGLNEDFNIGNPAADCSVLELAEMVVELAGSSSEIVVTGSEIEDIVERSPNVDKLAANAGFAPSIDLRSGLTDTIDWLRAEQA